MLHPQKPVKLTKRPSPQSEAELLTRSQALMGLTFAHLAMQLGLALPSEPAQRKGWVGQALEIALGTNAGNLAQPDFVELGIELKTVPINHRNKPAESTFVTSIPLLTIHEQTWITSQCLAKLQRVLWVPIEGEQAIPFGERRIGQAVIWSPTEADLAILASDWQELVFLMSTGRLAEVDARQGQYLQVRPKASNARALCHAYDEEGTKILTLPRGFYLRTSFTAQFIL